jgi:hypothetical protein
LKLDKIPQFSTNSGLHSLKMLLHNKFIYKGIHVSHKDVSGVPNDSSLSSRNSPLLLANQAEKEKFASPTLWRAQPLGYGSSSSDDFKALNML